MHRVSHRTSVHPESEESEKCKAEIGRTVGSGGYSISARGLRCWKISTFLLFYISMTVRRSADWLHALTRIRYEARCTSERASHGLFLASENKIEVLWVRPVMQ